MSRGQTPRTPVFFPKMKVRGARRKQMSAQRIRRHTELRVRPVLLVDGSMDLMVDPFGTHFAKITLPTLDGWGRTVVEPPKPKPRPDRIGSYTASLNFTGVDPELFDLITGRSS